MRVTKLIREYVEKTIAAKMPYGEPTEQYKVAKKKMELLHEEVNDRLETIAKQLVEDANLLLPKGFQLSVSSYHRLVQKSDYEAPLKVIANAHEAEIQQKRAEAVESILLELELGATKADLERLIAEAITR